MPMIPLYVVGVVAIIRRGQFVLAMRRAPETDADAVAWEAISGKLEYGEQPYDGVIREIREECCLDVRVGPQPIAAEQTLRNGHPMVLLFYEAEYLGGDVRLSPEHEAYEWLAPDVFAERCQFSLLSKLVRTVGGVGGLVPAQSLRVSGAAQIASAETRISSRLLDGPLEVEEPCC